MGKGFKHGAGGANPLNFKVVGGSSAPSSPKENTIWVNTDTAITSWDFSATEPGSSAEGMVWFLTGTSSSGEFNALKKNAIQVYPISVNQYVGGAWVKKTAKTYQGGEWKAWTDFLYNEGAEIESVTGGWETVPIQSTSGNNWGFNYGSGCVSAATKQDECIYLYAKSKAAGHIGNVAVYTLNAIDLSKYTKLSVRYENATSLAIAGYTGNPPYEVYSGYTFKQSAPDGSGVCVVDISSVNTSNHILLGTFAYSDSSVAETNATIQKVWLE